MTDAPRWRRRAHWAAFIIGVPIGVLVLIPLQRLVELAVLESVPEQQSMLRFGSFAVLLWCWVIGSISMLLGASIARRNWLEPRASYSALSGVTYTAVTFSISVLVLTAPGTAGARLFLIWFLLFPAAATIALAWVNHQIAIKRKAGRW